MENNKASQSSLLPTLLLVLFTALKLTGVITWSWWLVLSPLWIPAGLSVVVGIVLLGVWIRKR